MAKSKKKKQEEEAKTFPPEEEALNGEDFKAHCKQVRIELADLKEYVEALYNNPMLDDEDEDLPEGNIPGTRNENMRENLKLVFQALEDGRMRLGKVMQCLQGGKSRWDKNKNAQSNSSGK